MGLNLADKRVLILGAGGAVRGVLGPLLEQQLREVTIANRTPARAELLAREFGDLGKIVGCGFAQVRGPAYDIIINATSAGLYGEMPAMPANLVNEASICYDMAYGRGHTPFTLWAQGLQAGYITKGWGMLVEQAAEAFEWWRGVRPETAPVIAAMNVPLT